MVVILVTWAGNPKIVLIDSQLALVLDATTVSKCNTTICILLGLSDNKLMIHLIRSHDERSRDNGSGQESPSRGSA